MEKATDIILVICGTLLCVGGMFSVGNTFRSVLGIGLSSCSSCSDSWTKNYIWPFGKDKKKKGGGSDEQEQL